MLTENQNLLIRMLASLGISEATALACSELGESQMEEIMEALVEMHEEGTDATEEDVIKMYLILMREADKT